MSKPSLLERVWYVLFWPPLRAAYLLTKNDTIEQAGFVAICFCGMWTNLLILIGTLLAWYLGAFS